VVERVFYSKIKCSRKVLEGLHSRYEIFGV